jgi:hypothetical protein
MNNHKEYKKLEWLVNNISTVRDVTKESGATWYNLDEKNISPKDKIYILISIASDSDLPAKLKEDTVKSIKGIYLRIQTAATVLSRLQPQNNTLFNISIILTIGTIPVSFWEGKLRGSFGKLPIFKGLIEWPGLISNQQK